MIHRVTSRQAGASPAHPQRQRPRREQGQSRATHGRMRWKVQQANGRAAARALYVPKVSLPMPRPDQITVTVEVSD